eukprot:s4194_g9.t1
MRQVQCLAVLGDLPKFRSSLRTFGSLGKTLSSFLLKLHFFSFLKMKPFFGFGLRRTFLRPETPAIQQHRNFDSTIFNPSPSARLVASGMQTQSSLRSDREKLMKDFDPIDLPALPAFLQAALLMTSQSDAESA